MRAAVTVFKTWGERASQRRITGLLTVVIVSAVHLLTLKISPPIWEDEVQAIDLGRATLWPSHKAWSMNWVPAQRPITFLNYLGPTLQELAYRATPSSPVGPRISAILGALLASALAYAWLRRRGISRLVAWLVAVAFLLDPLFVASYRGARIDNWVFACIFAACIAIRRGADADRSVPSAARYFLGAGAFAVVGFFVWPSAFYLYPLLLVELFEVSRGRSRLAIRRWLPLFIFGGFACFVVGLLPLLGQLADARADLSVSKNAYLTEGTFQRRIMTGLVALPAAIRISPLLPLLAIAGITCRKNAVLALGMALALFMMLPTHVYTNRVLFLLPYFLALVGEWFMSVRGRTFTRLRGLLLGATLAWAVGLSLIARPAVAWSERSGRNPDRLFVVAEEMLGRGPRKVYLDPYEFYYAGRSLGWELYRAYSTFSVGDWHVLLTTLDAAIVAKKEAAKFAQAFADAGLERSGEFRVGSEPDRGGIPIKASPFGVYLVYSRPLSH